jgi:hypothetical protein
MVNNIFTRVTFMQRLLFFIVLCSIFSAGCSPSVIGVRTYGTVTLDGAPLETGNIAFHRNGVDQSFGSVISNGKYELYTEPGEMTVRITAVHQTGTKPRNDFPGDTVTDPVLESIIPAKYNTKTTLSCTIGTNGGAQNFELISK